MQEFPFDFSARHYAPQILHTLWVSLKSIFQLLSPHNYTPQMMGTLWVSSKKIFPWTELRGQYFNYFHPSAVVSVDSEDVGVPKPYHVLQTTRTCVEVLLSWFLTELKVSWKGSLTRLHSIAYTGLHAICRSRSGWYHGQAMHHMTVVFGHHVLRWSHLPGITLFNGLSTDIFDWIFISG